MDINELITKAESFVGDNKELGSIIGEIKSATGAIVSKKDELVEKVSTLSGGIKELGGTFGIEKESAKDIIGEIARYKESAENKINTLSGDKDSVLNRLAEFESKLNSSNEIINTLKSENEQATKANLLNEKTNEIRELLASKGIKDPNSQRLALADLKDTHGDLLSINDTENVISEFAKNNLKLVDSDLKSGNGSKVNIGDLKNKKISEMSKVEQAEYFKAKYGLNS